MPAYDINNDGFVVKYRITGMEIASPKRGLLRQFRFTTALEWPPRRPRCAIVAGRRRRLYEPRRSPVRCRQSSSSEISLQGRH